MHKVDLSKYSLRSDLIIENKDNYKIIEEYENNKVKVSNLEDNNSGRYITISFDDITDSLNYSNVKTVVINEIKKILEKEKISKEMSALIIGLGNINSTPDALGSKVIQKIIVTRHLYLLNDYDPKYRNVSSFIPGVMGNSGIETADIIKALVDKIKPDFVIAIDSLCASSISRINKTIQLTNTGIHPGSGIGNNRIEISKRTIGIPVIAIGVPTVVNSVVIVHDTIEYLMKKVSYLKKEQPLSDKLIPINKIKYYETENNLTEKEKQDLLGYFGLLSEDDKKKLFYEILSPIDSLMIVTVNEIDFIIDKLSNLLSESLNKSLHQI